MAEWSKALVLGTSHFDGVGSNPTAAKVHFFPSDNKEKENISSSAELVETNAGHAN